MTLDEREKNDETNPVSHNPLQSMSYGVVLVGRCRLHKS